MVVRSGDLPSHRKNNPSSPATLPLTSSPSSPSPSPFSGSKGGHFFNGKSNHHPLGGGSSSSWKFWLSKSLLYIRQARVRTNNTSQIMFLIWLSVCGLYAFTGFLQENSAETTKWKNMMDGSIFYKKRIVALAEGGDITVVKGLQDSTVQKYRTEDKVPYLEKPPKDKASKYDYASDDAKTSKCEYISDWQKQSSAPTNCNIMHEVGIQAGNPGLLNRLEYIDQGRLKTVWRVYDETNSQQKFVLKTSVFGRDFNNYEYDNHRRDAMVMAEATSPYVLDNFSYCHYSSLAESATGTLSHWVREYNTKVSGYEKLQVAVMIANGVEGMHLFNDDGLPTFAHADIKPPQFLLIEDEDDDNDQQNLNWKFKINDFNRGKFLTSNHPPKICPFYMGSNHKGSTMRSPEEYTSNAPQDDKIDVYSMGSVFYFLLTGHDPFRNDGEGTSFKQAMENIRTGIRPPLDSTIRDSKDPSIIAILKAMDASQAYKSKDRPLSSTIASQLRNDLQRIQSSDSTSSTNKK